MNSAQKALKRERQKIHINNLVTKVLTSITNHKKYKRKDKEGQRLIVVNMTELEAIKHHLHLQVLAKVWK